MSNAVGDSVAFLALMVSIFAAVGVAYQDTGRWRRLERYGNAVQAAKSCDCAR